MVALNVVGQAVGHQIRLGLPRVVLGPIARPPYAIVHERAVALVAHDAVDWKPLHARCHME